MTLIIILVFWFIPGIILWYYFHLTFSNRGLWAGSDPDGFWVFMILCPILNIVGHFLWIIQFPLKGQEERRIKWYKKFFLIK